MNDNMENQEEKINYEKKNEELITFLMKLLPYIVKYGGEEVKEIFKLIKQYRTEVFKLKDRLCNHLNEIGEEYKEQEFSQLDDWINMVIIKPAFEIEFDSECSRIRGCDYDVKSDIFGEELTKDLKNTDIDQNKYFLIYKNREKNNYKLDKKICISKENYDFLFFILDVFYQEKIEYYRNKILEYGKDEELTRLD